MKEQDLHLMLWQKRNELRISDDVQHDWLDMQAMLDVQMPVPAPTTGKPATGNGGASGAAGAAGLSGIKLLSILLVTLGIAVLTYFAVNTIATKNQAKQKTVKTIKDSNRHILSKSTNTSRANGNNLDESKDPTDLITNNKSSNPDKTYINPPSANAKDNGNPIGNAGVTTGINTMAKTPDKTGRIVSTDNNNVFPNHNKNSAANNKISNAVPGSNTAMAGSGSHTVNRRAVNTPGNPTNNNNTGKKTSPHLLPNKTPGRSIAAPGMATRLSPSGSNATVLRNRTNSNTLHNKYSAGPAWSGIIHYGNTSANGKSHTRPLSRRHIPLGIGAQRGPISANQHSGSTNHPTVRLDSNATVKDNSQNASLTEALQTRFAIEQYQVPILPSALTDKFKEQQSNGTLPKNTGSKNASGTKGSKPDWGLLAGANSAGSFTGKSQNANFYGSFPLDLYFGLFATYNFTDKWAVNLSIRGLNPQNVSGSYTHKNESKIDTLQTLNMSDSRKIYFVDVPLNLVFRPGPALSIKAGPVFSLPVKQANGISIFQTGKLKKDSAYYAGVTKTINATNYTPSLNMGLSGGVSFQTGRFIFDAAYIIGLKGVNIGSSLGSYTADNSSFLFTVGFKLNRLFKK